MRTVDAAWNWSSWTRAGPPVRVLTAPRSLRGRVYAYDVPARWKLDAPVTMNHGIYQKADRIFHGLLLASDAMTASSADASIYFAPIYVGALVNKTSRRSDRLADVDAALACGGLCADTLADRHP